jgi:hypothetical protein
MMPKFLSIAAAHPFVMHSILAFSASHLAWISQSNETRNLAFHHASIALKGLHDGITSFTKMNADAVLASSLLLAWQATDWCVTPYSETPIADKLNLGEVGPL